MTPQEIFEGNKLIAEFMGYDDVDCPNCKHTRDCNWLQCGLTPHEKDEQLKYHSSWDWLMHVVEKIELIGYTVSIAKNKCRISNFRNTANIGLTINTSEDSKIKTVWISCVKFIKWYNQNKS